MSMRSEFSERSGSQALNAGESQVHLGLRARLSLKAEKGFTHTVTPARALARRRVSLSVARHAVERLAAGSAVTVLAPRMDDGLITELKQVHVRAAPLEAVSPSVLKSVRERLSMSQDQFANAYAIDYRTLQNWERRTGSLDAATSLLVRVIQAYPDLVESAAAGDPITVKASVAALQG